MRRHRSRPRRRRRGRLPSPRRPLRTGPTSRRSGSRAERHPSSRTHGQVSACSTGHAFDLGRKIRRAKRASRAQTDAPEPARAAKAPATGSEELRVKPYRELPDEVRRKLPKLVFGGSIHSDQASDRILIVNGQLLREGETAAPGVVLEQIKRQSAVFKSGDYRYEMSY